jgi:hypothetical protein
MERVVLLFLRDMTDGEDWILCPWEREASWRSWKARSQEGEAEGFSGNSRNQTNSVSNQMSNSRIHKNLSGKTFPVPSVRTLPTTATAWSAAAAARACDILLSFYQLLNVVDQNSTI